MISFDPALVVAIVNVITLLILIGGVFWLGKLGNRVSNLENRVDQLETRIDHVDKKVDQLADEMREMREAIRQEIRHGNQQLLLALANHSPDADSQPIFRIPVNPE